MTCLKIPNKQIPFLFETALDFDFSGSYSRPTNNKDDSLGWQPMVDKEASALFCGFGVMVLAGEGSPLALFGFSLSRLLYSSLL